MCCVFACFRLLYPEGRQDSGLNFVLPTGLCISSSLRDCTFSKQWPLITAALQLQIGSILALSRIHTDPSTSGDGNPCTDLSIRKLDPQQGAAALAAVAAASCPCHNRGLCDTSGWPLEALPPGIIAAAVGAVRASLEERPATRPSYAASNGQPAAASKALQPQAVGRSSSAAACAVPQSAASPAATQLRPQSEAADSDTDSAATAEGGSTSGDTAALGATAASISCDISAEQSCSAADGSSPAAEAAAAAVGSGAAAAQSISGASEVDSGATAPVAEKAAAGAKPDTATTSAAPGSPQLGATTSRDPKLPADMPAQRTFSATAAEDLTVSVSDDIVMLLSDSDDESVDAAGVSASAAAAPADDSSPDGSGASADKAISSQADARVAAGGTGGKAASATAAGPPGQHRTPPLPVPHAAPPEQQRSSPRPAGELSVPDTAPVASEQPAEAFSVPDTAPVTSVQPAEALSVPDTAPVAGLSSADEDTASTADTAPKSGLAAAEGLGGAEPQAALDLAAAAAAKPSQPALQPHKAHEAADTAHVSCQGLHIQQAGSVQPALQRAAAAGWDAQQQQQAAPSAQGPVTVVFPHRKQPVLPLPYRLSRYSLSFSSRHFMTAEPPTPGQWVKSVKHTNSAI